MLGDDVPTLTRTVVASGWLGHLLSESMLHIDVHGIHHRYAKIPHFRLPEAVRHVYDSREQATAIQTSYGQALLEMLGTLGNPRVGKQWLPHAKASSTRFPSRPIT
jgi:fatty acid desaturase